MRFLNFFKCRPWTAVDVILYKKQKHGIKFLVVRRKYEPYKHYYVFPGGFVECGETAEQAASRELEEETGISLSFEKQDQFRVYSHPKRDPRHHVISIVFAKEVKNLENLNFKESKETFDIAVLSLKNKKEVLGFDHEFILRDFYSSLMA
ncbi:MAG: NUDIX hydrolase [Candidatus Nanohaloarchaeota archaeon]|nr:NUDIX hydrolase [Candidatus Nanohaloarchaeota archaeon]